MTLTLAELAAEVERRKMQTFRVHDKFVDFCAWLGVDWDRYPAQRLIAGVCYDGEDVPDTPLARTLFGGFVGAIDAAIRAVIVVVAGRRGGKTYTLVSLRLLWGMFVRDLSSLAPGQQAVALVVSLNPKLRQEAVNYALGAARSKPELRATLILPKGTKDEDTPSEFKVRRPDGHIVSFEGGVATAGGYGARGRSITDLALDEIAFFRDRSAKVNDKDIFDAGTKAVLPGGQTIPASSPWAQRGLLWELFSENFGKPTTAVAIQAPTVVLNPAMAAKVALERARDPDAAKNELDAQFLEAGTTIFLSDALIESCVDEALSLPMLPEPGDTVRAGGDFAFRRNAAALGISHERAGIIRTADLVELRPEPGKPLKPSLTVQKFVVHLRAHGTDGVMSDGHYREAIVEHLGDLALYDRPNAPHEVWVRVRMLMREGRVKIPRHYVVNGQDLAQRLIRQLKELEARPLAGGAMQMLRPTWSTGEHGDLAEAWAESIYQQHGDAIEAKPPPKGSPEWEAAEEQRHAEEYDREQAGDWWERQADKSEWWRG